MKPAPPKHYKNIMRTYMLFLNLLVLLAALLLTSCGYETGTGNTAIVSDNASLSVYANRVVDYSPVPLSKKGEQFYDSSVILGAAGSSLDVVSLGFDSTQDNATGGSITLGFGAKTNSYCIVDGSGDDFVVTENAFYIEGDQTRSYNEVAYVEASEDGANFFRFSSSVDSSFSLEELKRYTGFAGVLPEGDRFDLNTLIKTHSLSSSFRACFIRIIDAGTQVSDADTSSPVSNGSGADINALQALNFDLL